MYIYISLFPFEIDGEKGGDRGTHTHIGSVFWIEMWTDKSERSPKWRFAVEKELEKRRHLRLLDQKTRLRFFFFFEKWCHPIYYTPKKIYRMDMGVYLSTSCQIIRPIQM